jgi:hypothetical protein
MTILLILFLGLLIEYSNADGSIQYAIGLPDGSMWQQVNGLISFQWLVTICTICFLAEAVTMLFTKALHPVASQRATHPEELLSQVTRLMRQYKIGGDPTQTPTSRYIQERKSPTTREGETSVASSLPGASSISASFIVEQQERDLEEIKNMIELSASEPHDALSKVLPKHADRCEDLSAQSRCQALLECCAFQRQQWQEAENVCVRAQAMFARQKGELGAGHCLSRRDHWCEATMFADLGAIRGSAYST